MKNLMTYMAERGIGNEQAAKEIGCSTTYLSLLRRKKAKPSFDMLMRISKWSGGEVTAESFENS